MKYCKTCGKSFMSTKSLSNHVRWHKGIMDREDFIGINKGEKHGQWKGDKVGYHALHTWVRARIPKPKLCVKCKKNKAFDLANISQQYKRDINDFRWLCRSCHMKEDGRLKKLHTRKEKYCNCDNQQPEVVKRGVYRCQNCLNEISPADFAEDVPDDFSTCEDLVAVDNAGYESDRYEAQTLERDIAR